MSGTTEVILYQDVYCDSEPRTSASRHVVQTALRNTIKGKAWSGPEGSRTTAQDGGKVVSLTHRPPLPPGNTPGTHFC